MRKPRKSKHAHAETEEKQARHRREEHRLRCALQRTLNRAFLVENSLEVAVRAADPESRVHNDVLQGETDDALHRRRERLEMHIRAHLFVRSGMMRNPEEGLSAVRAVKAPRRQGHHCEDNLRKHGYRLFATTTDP